MIKIVRRVDPVLFSKIAEVSTKKQPANNVNVLEKVKTDFEREFGELDLTKRWVFIGVAFKFIYPKLYGDDVRDLQLFDGFNKKMCEVMGMLAPNFTEEFKKVCLNLRLKDSDLKDKVDRVYEILGYHRGQQDLFGNLI